MSAFNPTANTPEEHAENCIFQLANIQGYLDMADRLENPSIRQSAAIKAECLLESAKKLVAAFEAEARLYAEARGGAK